MTNGPRKPRGAPENEDKPGERFFGKEETSKAGSSEAPARKQKKATVAIARTTERFRDDESITRLVEEALAHLGGMEAFVQPGQTVLIKPNQTGYFLADEGMTTYPRL